MNPTSGITIVRKVADLRAWVSAERSGGTRVGLVPTMGALHEGHLSLVRMSLQQAARTAVTLFVNPKQFNPNEDLGSYPRDEAGDIAMLEAEGAHLLFAPDIEEMYPDGSVTEVSVPGIGDILEGQFRPGFFTGVATVVAKLLLQALPDTAFFGEKDFQQLLVIRRMTHDLDIPVEIVGAPTVREADGLAMSSRNAYLTGEERAVAPVLYQTISRIARDVRDGAGIPERTAWARQRLSDAGFGPVDYVEVCNAETLAPMKKRDEQGRVLAAATLGKARLIDNVAV
ncbi:MAG: pantoate--beta-alanine ligase [Rhodospirillales bacterium]|nr:pantoate--beta-alanine ligase [Rhodospirillales bacterium]